jgi:flagellar hook-associated protein 3 FlgL
MATISTLGQALDQMERLNALQSKLSTLQGQIATGHKGNTYMALGSGADGALGSQRARSNYSKLDTYITNITIADRRMSIMTNALSEMRAQAGNVQAALGLQPAEGTDTDIETVGKQADTVMQFLTTLVNSKDGNRYLFAGADSDTQPLNGTSTMDTYEQSQINDWVNGTITTDQLIQSYRDQTKLDDSTLGYSPTLASGTTKGVSVRTDDNTEVDYTVLGNTSSIRDVLTSISMIKNLTLTLNKITSDPSDPPGTKTAPGATTSEQSQNFYKVYNDLQDMLTKALGKLDLTNENLTQTQAQVEAVSDNHKTDQATLQGISSDIENVDLNEAAVQLNSLQTQLEASYRVTATLSQLSLVNFLK